MRTALVYLIALAALAIGAFFGLPEMFASDADGTEIETKAKPAAPPVVVAAVRRAQFADTLEALGTVVANESVEITPNRADNVTAIHFRDGQAVEKDQLLVEMNATEEAAMLTEATAVRDERRVNRDRAVDLHENKMISDRELDAARTLLAASEARVISLEAQIADRQVRAPFAGVLGLRRISIGAFVQPSTVITTLDDLSVVKLDFTIPETWLPAVRAGQTVRATSDAWPGETFTGEISVLDTRLDRSSRSATVRALMQNPDTKLRPGMLLKVLVERGEEPVLQVPEEAVILIGEQQFVLRIDESSTAQRVEVATGRRRPGTVEIVRGLDESDRVVVEGIVRVRPGQPVRVVATRESKP